MAKKNPRSGYALLFVYMMAATVAIMLYTQMPRVAFEAQRDKEQLLVDRGEQYRRAVQLYVRKFNRFPADMQALENTQNIRFLRRQYVDPMTGKNEWRLIHVGPGGVFTDSKVYGKQNKKDGQGAPQTFIATVEEFANGTSGGNQGVNLATRRRPSDETGAPGTANDPNNPGGQPGATPGSTPAPISGPVMVLPDGRIVPATPNGVPAPTNNPNTLTGQTGVPPPPGVVPPGFTPPNGIGIQQGASGFGGAAGVPGSTPPLPGQSGFQNTPNAPPTSAANLINQILTTPRPGGLNGLGGTDPTANAGTISSLTGGAANNTGTPAGQTLGGTQIGGGFAGVASKYEQEGIKSYNGRSSYDEWEFVYDLTKDKTRGGPGALPNQQIPQGQQSGTNPAAPNPLSGGNPFPPPQTTGTGK